LRGDVSADYARAAPWRALAAGCAAIAALAGAGCATVGPAPATRLAKPDPVFDVAGRLSARHGSDGVAANFTWVHAPAGDRLDVATPLGQIVARLAGDANGVRVERPGEAPVAYADWNALTRAVFGVAIPVQGLAAWIQGAPAGGDAAIEADAVGRPLVLREQGWEIVYAYADDAAARPVRLVMRYPDSEPVEVRIVVDRWATVGAGS
jgi:outer membrane lipoprotein LolB